MKKEVLVNRQVKFTFSELLKHFDEDFKDRLCTALSSRDLSHVICYSRFSEDIEFSLTHSEFVKDF